MNSISVIVPWGKLAGDIERSLNSVFIQTRPVEEVIIVANGEVARSDIEDLLPKLPSDRLAFYNMPGCRNANVARNYGTALARCSWIAFLDSDDWWDADHIDKSMSRLMEVGADFIYSGMRILGRNGEMKELIAEDYREFDNMESYLLSYLPAPTGSLIVRRRCVLDQPWDSSLRRHQDYDFSSRLASRYVGCHKYDITLNVDWSSPTKHKAHADCLRVLNEFQGKLREELYSSHLWNIFRSAFKANDFVWIRMLPSVFPIFGRKVISKLSEKAGRY